MARKKTEEPNGAPEAGEPKPVETKADKFRRLANRRLYKLEKAAASIANLGNVNAYEFTDEQKEIVLRVVAVAHKRVMDAFDRRRVPAEGEASYV